MESKPKEYYWRKFGLRKLSWYNKSLKAFAFAVQRFDLYYRGKKSVGHKYCNLCDFYEVNLKKIYLIFALLRKGSIQVPYAMWTEHTKG